MRALTILFAFSALGSIFLLLDRVTAPGGEGSPGIASAEAIDVARALTNRAGLAVQGLVLGPDAGGERDFRGLHSAEGRLRPVYGRARVICTDQAVGPSCWEISYLEINGREVAHSVRALETREAPPDDRKDEEIETADIQPPHLTRPAAAAPPPITGRGAVEPPAGVTLSVAASPEIEERTETTDVRQATGEVPIPAIRPVSFQPVEAELAATHQVDRSIINVRAGPGTDKALISRLTRGTRLALVESEADWGRFIVVDGTFSGQKVWAAMKILKALR